MPRVVLEGVTKVFDGVDGKAVKAVSNLSLSLEERECLVMVGPSGSGKTTVLRLIAGLETATIGRICIGGRLLNSVPSDDRGVAMVFQTPPLYPHMSVYENLEFGLRLRGETKRDRSLRVAEVAEVLRLSSLLQAQPAEISGGERQRVAIGRAILHRPEVLLLDEPLANIDPPFRARLRQDILDVRQKFGTSLIYVTHDHLEAMLVGDRIAVLCEGELQQLGPASSIYQRPANRFVAGFFGFPPINLFPGKVCRENGDVFFKTSESGFSLKLSPARASLLQGQGTRDVLLGVRPEQIEYSDNLSGSESSGCILAKIRSVQFTGADAYVTAACFGHCFVARASVSFAGTTNQEYAFFFGQESICFFEPITGAAL